MNKIQRGLRIAAMLLSLLTVGVVADMGTQRTLQAQVIGSCNCGKPSCQGCLKGRFMKSKALSPAPVAHTADCGCNAVPQVVYSQPTPVYSAPVASCGCKKSGCTSCRKKKSCPKCDCQFCELEVKKGEVEKTSYKTEQKEVCIPAVRLPWKKCCPPKRSKVRTVNVLKKHKYKCPQCQYKWSVHEPEDFPKPTKADTKQEFSVNEGFSEPAGSGSKASAGSGTRGSESTAFPDPTDALGDVPPPPVGK